MQKSMTTIAAVAALLAGGAYAADYTWMASPADALWNVTSFNWNSGEAWVDSSSSPNNAIFPEVSSQKTITLPSGETRHVNNMTVNGAYTFGGSGSIGLQGTLTVGKPCTFNAGIAAKKASGLDYSTSTAVAITDQNSTVPSVFDPGEGRTNIVGRLSVKSRLKIASGVTVLGSASNPSDANSMLYIQGNWNTFSSNMGKLEVAGGTLYAAQTRYVNVTQYGEATVKDGGKVYMPNVEWLNGLNNPGRLTVSNGEFVVNTLRICQSAASQVTLSKGGLIAANLLGINPGNTKQAEFLFNGGRIQFRGGISESGFLGSVTATPPTEEQWNAAVKFAVGTGGAVFDTSNGKNIFWSRPLLSDAAQDGGVRKFGNGILVFTHGNNYNGTTCVESGGVQLRADNALPPGSTLRLGAADAYVDGGTFDSSHPYSEQWIGRLEGLGQVKWCANMHITNSVAPAVNGTIDIQKACDLRGDYEITGDANGCGCIKVAEGQDISGLTLKVLDITAFNRDAVHAAYMILDAPNGYANKFAAGNLAEPWYVKYTDTAAYIVCKKGFVFCVR